MPRLATPAYGAGPTSDGLPSTYLPEAKYLHHTKPTCHMDTLSFALAKMQSRRVIRPHCSGGIRDGIFIPGLGYAQTVTEPTRTNLTTAPQEICEIRVPLLNISFGAFRPEGGTNVCFISLPGKTVCERARPSTSVCNRIARNDLFAHSHSRARARGLSITSLCRFC